MKSKILITFLIGIFCLQGLALAKVTISPMVILEAPFEYLGPADNKGLANQIYEGLSRRLQAKGHKVIQINKLPKSVSQLTDKAKDTGADYALYGSIVVLGDQIDADLRLLDIKKYTGPPKLIHSQAMLDRTPALMDILCEQIIKALSAQFMVDKVLVKGNMRIDTDAILRAISTKPGQPYDPKTISDDIKTIYKLGYFEDVMADVEQGPNGKLVTFLVREKPAIRQIEIQGNKVIKTDKIKEVIELKPYSIVNEKELQENAEKIRALYVNKGYVNTTVTATVKTVSAQVADVVFNITEGEKVEIKSITFQGNHHFKDDELKDMMETIEKRSPWIPSVKTLMALLKGQSPVLKWDALERDLGRIAAFYHNHGFVDAKVGQPEVTRKGKWLYITIPIQEGDRYGVGKVTIEQDYFKDTKELLSKLEIKKEKTFNQQTVRADIIKLTDVYADQGFAYADIIPRIQKDPEKKVVNITFVVHTGPKVRFERIEITGNTRTRDKVIRRELRVVELEPFSATGLRKSRQRLGRLGYFDDVSLAPTKGSKEDLMNLKVHVKERPTGTFSIGAGYSSVDKLIVMGEISQRNFLGKGQTLSFRGILGSQTNRYTFSFTEPYFRDTRLSFGVDLYNWEREYDDYTKNSTGGGLRFAYPITDDLTAYTGLRVDNTTLSDISDYASQIIRESVSINSTRAWDIGLTYDTRNDYYNPTQGWYNNASVEYAGGILGGDSAYVKLEGLSSYYHPIWKDIIGHARLGIGYVTESSGGKLPVYERFFLGGIDSVRGYKWGTISPIDPETGERVGGEYMGYLQLETIFPLLKDMGLNGVIFFDMGNVWDKDTGYDIGDLRKSVGLGIRWLSPMGPLRIEWGYNLDTEPGEEKSNWEFRMGGTF